MTEDSKQVKVWEKPELRRLDAADAETASNSGGDAVNLS